MRMASVWQRRSDLELANLVREVWEGRLLGSWQLADAAEIDWVFPGFVRLQQVAYNAELGFAAETDDPMLRAVIAAAPPRPRHAFARVRGNRAARSRGTADLPVAREWQALSAEEWERLSAMLGYPPQRTAVTEMGVENRTETRIEEALAAVG
jgi:hypothetical protein